MIANEFPGSVNCAPPEIWEARPYQGPEVDVWCLGVVLYCMVTGIIDDSQ